MRKLALLFLLTIILFIISCSDDNNNSPVIELISIEVNDSIKYPGINTTNIPPLTAEDHLNIQFRLRGLKNNLRSFQVYIDEENVSFIDIEISGEEEHISEEPNLTNPEEGYIGFVNDIQETLVNVKTFIKEVKNDEIILSFYLSTSTTGGESDKMELVFFLESDPE